jgi:hypothetical protein
MCVSRRCVVAYYVLKRGDLVAWVVSGEGGMQGMHVTCICSAVQVCGVRVLLLLHMCPYTSIYVFAYYCMCDRILHAYALQLRCVVYAY